MEFDTTSSDTDDFSDGSSIGVDDTLNPSRLLQNALRHIDGLIENCEDKRQSTSASESKLLVLSTELRVHIEELEQLQCEDGDLDIPEETLRVIYSWSKRQLGVQVCVYYACTSKVIICVYRSLYVLCVMIQKHCNVLVETSLWHNTLYH